MAVPHIRFIGSRTPHLTARPADATAADLMPSPDGDLHGAACTEADPDLFFPEDGDTFSTRRAKTICAMCPVRELCLALAMERGEAYGIFGGLDPAERRKLARRQSGSTPGEVA